MPSGRSCRHVSLGAASLAVGGAAFALIQILQGTIGAFNPRPIVTALIASRPSAAPNFGRTQSQIGSPYLLRDTSTGAGLLTWPVAAYVLQPASGSTPATLTTDADVSAGNRFGLLVDRYNLTPSAGAVTVSQANCAGARPRGR
jgi:hypothetical protein